MPAIKIENFGGELPSVSPRALPPNAAQENRNLYLATTEFRPLAQDAVSASTANGTRTLYRFSRDPSGTFNTNLTSGWITSTQERSYVKGQINDEKTERTYFTFDDGSARPRAIDNTGADRELGVYRPVKPTCTINAVDEFTTEEANNFLFGEGAEAVRKAFSDNGIIAEPASRYAGETIYGGPYSRNGLEYASAFNNTDYWNLHGKITPARADQLGLDLVRLYSAEINGFVWVPVTALPFTIRFNTAAIRSALSAVELPEGAGDKAGTRLFTDEQITEFLKKAEDYLNPSLFAKDKRDELDELTKEFNRLLTTAVVTTAPAEPVKTAYTYLDTTSGVTRNITQQPSGSMYGNGRNWKMSDGQKDVEYSNAHRNYDTAVARYEADLATYELRKAEFQFDSASLNNRLSEIQGRALAITREVETESLTRWEALTADATKVSDFLQAEGGVSAFVGETVTRLIDTRFYIVTFVTDWGEESAPSEPSDILEVDQNDTVTITRPNSTRFGSSLFSNNIQKWRIYRSNTGSATSSFQFVEELLTSTNTYTDSKKAEELGEVCPTLTWEPPPYRADLQNELYPQPVVGTNPFLRGLTGMPNGIMAGFFDNTVAFCEPYVPYAWPIEYQITTEFPIVGLGVFGQTLFVGTTGNPYFISGADSASMSAQKLDAKQSCSSRRSIVSVQGGVLYASPDGLCVADPSGVKVVSGGMYTREDWQKLNPATMVAASHENIYYLFYTGNGGGCLTFDLATAKLGRLDLTATATFTDTLTDTLYVANGTSIQSVFGSATRRTAKWKSPRMVLPRQEPVAWVKVYGDQTPEAPVTVRWYGDGALRHTAVFTDPNPQRLPAGRWLEHEVEVESAARVTRVVLAGNTQELQSV